MTGYQYDNYAIHEPFTLDLDVLKRIDIKDPEFLAIVERCRKRMEEKIMDDLDRMFARGSVFQTSSFQPTIEYQAHGICRTDVA